MKMGEIPNLVDLTNSMIAAAERKDMGEVARLKDKFVDSGKQITNNNLEQGYSMPKLLSGVYLHNQIPKYGKE